MHILSKRKSDGLTHIITKEKKGDQSIADQFCDAPILITAVGKVTSDDERYFSLRELFDGDLQGVGLAIQRHEHRCVHATDRVFMIRM